MRVVILGSDFRARFHLITWLARAYTRLGCETFVVSPGGGCDVSPDGYTDPLFVNPTHYYGDCNGGRMALGQAISQIGSVDLAVMVDQGANWGIINDGSVPFAYWWRETNPNFEAERILQCAGSAPIHYCMLGEGKYPANAQMQYLPFAVDRDVFNYRLPFEERPIGFVYTGRERGNNTLGWMSQVMNSFGVTSHCQGYVNGYSEYGNLLAQSRVTYTVDSGRYVGSRGLEASCTGVVCFYDGGEAFNRMGFEFGRDCLKLETQIDVSTGELVPMPLCVEEMAKIANNRDHWEWISQNARKAIMRAHTYEHRAVTIANSVGVKLPKTIEEVCSLSQTS